MSKLQEIAHDIYVQYREDPQGVEELKKKILKDEDLLAEAIQLACWHFIDRARYQIRLEIKADEARDFKPKRYSKELQDRLSQSLGKYYEWPMRDGSRLADADKAHVLQDAGVYAKVAKSHRHNALFLETVAKKMKEGEKVKDVWDQEELQRVMRKIQGKKGGNDGDSKDKRKPRARIAG